MVRAAFRPRAERRGGQAVEPPPSKKAKGTKVIEITIEETGKRNVD